MFAETLGWKKMFAVIGVAMGHGCRHCQIAVAILVVIIVTIMLLLMLSSF